MKNMLIKKMAQLIWKNLLYLISGLWHSFGSSFAHLLPDVVGSVVRSTPVISPANSLAFPTTEECSKVKQNFTSFTGKLYCILAFSRSRMAKVPKIFTGETCEILGNK